jgi:hypothetical protein
MIKKITKGPFCNLRWITAALLSLLIIFQHESLSAISCLDSSSPVPAAAFSLVQFCDNPAAKLDTQAVETVVDYVLGSKANQGVALPNIKDAAGAYYEFDSGINFSNFIQYAFNSKIPSSIISPASLRYSRWMDPQEELQKMPSRWQSPLPINNPLIIHGMERDGTTPDLTTGVYYDYSLKRTLILFNHKGRKVLISISKQVNTSDVGKKGFIIGKDSNWNYYYSDEIGLDKMGLGWVKSFIYDLFSVSVYVESDASSHVVKSGMFQWIRAGWSGLNFVKAEHIIKGQKRYSECLRAVLESPNLPALSQLVSDYQKLSALSHPKLVERYASLQQSRQSLAVSNGAITADEIKKDVSYSHVPKEQIIEELMIEYLKLALGKSSLVMGKTVSDQSIRLSFLNPR